MPIRFFRVTALLIALHGTLAVADGMDLRFLDNSQRTMEQAQHAPLPNWLQTPPARLPPDLEKLLLKDRVSSDGPGSPVDDKLASQSKREGKWIFASFAMPVPELKAALETASATRATVVFRGIRQGEDMRAFMANLHQIARGMEPRPLAILDPYLFREYRVVAVPTLVVAREGKTRLVRGSLGMEWLEQKNPGDYGQRGPTYPVAEPDMIEEMKRRLASIDWDRQKADSIKDYWKKHADFVDLPEAREDRKRVVDPFLVVTHDIRTPDGRTLAKAGDKVNPQAIHPLSRAVVFLDATRPRQLAKVRELAESYAAKHKPVIFITSHVDTERGWEHWRELYSNLPGPVYLLQKGMADHFHIERLPSVLEGEGTALSVTEIGI